MAENNFNASCNDVTMFNLVMSSTFTSTGSAFQISYGSEEATGTLGEDIIQMTGFSVSNQSFAMCDTVSSGLLSNPVSGLLGLAFNVITSSDAMPFWEALVISNAWDLPVMAFQLTQYVLKLLDGR